MISTMGGPEGKVGAAVGCPVTCTRGRGTQRGEAGACDTTCLLAREVAAVLRPVPVNFQTCAAVVLVFVPQLTAPASCAVDAQPWHSMLWWHAELTGAGLVVTRRDTMRLLCCACDCVCVLQG